jgi:hypothetical protein
MLKDTPIRQKLMVIILLTSGAVLLLTCASFFTYEFWTFRQTMVRQASTIGKGNPECAQGGTAYRGRRPLRQKWKTIFEISGEPA